MMRPQELQAERLLRQAKRLVLDRRKQQTREEDFQNPLPPLALRSCVQVAWLLFRATPESAEQWTCCAGLTTHSGCRPHRSEEHTSELQSQSNLVCRLLLEKKKNNS